jgi:hypothetical protein
MPLNGPKLILDVSNEIKAGKQTITFEFFLFTAIHFYNAKGMVEFDKRQNTNQQRDNN